MASQTIDLVGTIADPSTQGLGRLIGQYTLSATFVDWLRRMYELAQDFEDMCQMVARVMNPDDDILFPPGTQAAGADQPTSTVNAQLDICGRTVGILRQLPDGTLLTNQLYHAVIKAKIARNHVRGGTIQQLIDQCVLIFTATSSDIDVEVSEPGRMCVLIVLAKFLTSQEEALFSITEGANFIRGAILPRMDGVMMLVSGHDAGCFCFSRSSNPGVPIYSDGVGFNTTAGSTTGHWARSYT